MEEKTLHDIFQAEIQQVVNSKSFLINVVRQHFEKAGVVLSPDQVKSIGNQIDAPSEGYFEIVFSDEQVEAYSNVGFDLSQVDFGQIDDDFEKEVSRVIQDLMKSQVDACGASLAAAWAEARSDILAERHQGLNEFYVYLNDIWGDVLDAFESFIKLCVELGEYQLSDGLGNTQPRKREVLARLHARSCQVSNEIYTLLRFGFADGAHARWRTLHELATVGEFLLNAPDEVAEMYAIHANVSRAKEAEEFQSRQHSFGYEPISDVDMNEILTAKKDAQLRFGPDFIKDYGWATQHLKANYAKKGNQTTFLDIELAVNNSNLRNYYRLANRNVHAGFWGELSRLGDNPKWSDNILLAGPSHFGLAIPAYNTVYSLGMLTLGLLCENSTLETLISSKALYLSVVEFNKLVMIADNKSEQWIEKPAQQLNALDRLAARVRRFLGASHRSGS